MAIPLPALDVQPPRPPDLLGQYQKMVALRNLSAQGAMIPEEARILALRNRMIDAQNQQAQLQLQQQQVLANASRGVSQLNGSTPETATGAPEGASGQIGELPIKNSYLATAPTPQEDPLAGIEQAGIEAVRNGAGEYGIRFLQGVMGLRKNIAAMNASKAQADKAEQATNAVSLEAMANGASAVLASGNDPRVVNTFLGVMGNFLPREAASLRAAFQANPASIGPTMQAFRAYSVQQMNELTRQQLAQTSEKRLGVEKSRLDLAQKQDAARNTLLQDRNNIEQRRVDISAAKASGSGARQPHRAEFLRVEQAKDKSLKDAEAQFGQDGRTPNPGDLIKAKQQAQNDYEGQLSVLVGHAVPHYQYAGTKSATNASGSTVPRVGMVENGFMFIGGDPSIKSSWRKLKK